jgi:hypothetical protein
MELKAALEIKLQAQLDEWTAVVSRLRAKADKAHGDLRMAFMADIDELAAYQERAETYLHELNQTQGDAWKDMEHDIELVQGEMRQAMDRAWKRIKI